MSILPIDMIGEIAARLPAKELQALRATCRDTRRAVDEAGRFAVQKLSHESQEKWITFFQRKFSTKNPDEVKEMFLAGKLYSLMEKHKKWMDENALCVLARQNPTIISATGDAKAIRAWLEEYKDQLAALDTLKLDCADMEALPLELLHYFPNIKTLTVKNLKIADEVLGAFPKLETLDLLQSPLTTLPASLGSSNITSLKVNWRNIKTLPKEIYHAQNDYIRTLGPISARRFLPLMITFFVIGALLVLFSCVVVPFLTLPLAAILSLGLLPCLLSSIPFVIGSFIFLEMRGQ